MKPQEFGTLIRAINHNVNMFIRGQVEPFGLGWGQFEYFMQIHSTPGINQLELARIQNVGKASVTKALRILEDGGFIIRESDRDDRRNMLCFLSPSGHQIVRKLLDVKKMVARELFDGFTERDTLELSRLLARLSSNSGNLISGLITQKKEGECDTPDSE